MDRNAIERRDFPVGRRGYEQEAVDAHLRRVADELDALRGRPLPAPPPASLAAGASEQVRAILEAAEASAAALRADAGRQAGEHVARVQEATGGMLSRLDALERELGNLLDALRRSGERLTEGLAQLQAEVGEAAAGEAPAAANGTGPVGDEGPAPAAANGTDPAAPTEPDASPPPAGDEAGARLIALNMALNGAPREETARYLAEHFALRDPDALLDDVYAGADQ